MAKAYLKRWQSGSGRLTNAPRGFPIREKHIEGRNATATAASKLCTRMWPWRVVLSFVGLWVAYCGLQR